MAPMSASAEMTEITIDGYVMKPTNVTEVAAIGATCSVAVPFIPIVGVLSCVCSQYAHMYGFEWRQCYRAIGNGQRYVAGRSYD